MLAKAESGCFVIADISGYTNFVSGVELDHAQDIIADIMDTLVRALRPPFRLAKFEGDAAFLYAAGEKLDGSHIQDSIESAYFAFRKRLRSIKQANSCECEACRGMQSLDVKFVVHCGEFIRQRFSGREELAGRDVILVHRLLKNDIKSSFGPHAYALYTDASARALGIDPAAQGLVAHNESIDVIGEVKGWVSDLEIAWRHDVETQRVLVPSEAALAVIDAHFDAPRAAVWEILTSPEHRPHWQHSDGVIEATSKGRRGAGTQNHCMHGKDAIVEDILDWRPFDYLTLTTLLPVPGAPKILMSYVFNERADGGVLLEMRIANPKAKDLPFLEKILPGVREKYAAFFKGLRAMLDERARQAEVVEDPPARASNRSRVVSSA
jgi:uncharacterized protein YndB with AHSA1/START domain